MKKILALTAVALFAVGSLMAQVPGGINAGRPTSPSSGSNAGAPANDIKVFAIELGTGFAYNLGTKNSGANQTVSAIFGLSDGVQAGFSVIRGDDTNSINYTLVKVAVYPISDLAVVLNFGSATTAAKVASGFGVSYNLFKNTTTALSTALQGNVSYLFTDVSTGSLLLGLNLKVGL